jgi:mono/diheme cytochrome c family protein
MRYLFLLACAPAALLAHDAHGRSNAPAEARRLKNPVARSDAALATAKERYAVLCANCHGDDGRSRTKAAGAMPTRPTDLSNYLMESMKDGEIYWVIANGIDQRMPAFSSKLSGTECWELVLYVRQLRETQRAIERAQLGPYEWKLPPGFPYPKVPTDNPMTKEKVELGRYLFYDKRHHDKHHQAYVDNLNKALATRPELSGKPIDKLIGDIAGVPEPIRAAVRNNGGGHLNHSLFWQTMGKPKGGPKGRLQAAISKSIISTRNPFRWARRA